MAKIIIAGEGGESREFELDKDRITIGRHPRNDIVLGHRAVSGEHAAITLTMDDVYLEDLGSTNGTFINGERIAKQRLENRDRILIATSRLDFAAGPRAAAAAPAVPAPRQPAGPPLTGMGRIEVKSGPNAGKKLLLDKPLSTLGRPGVQVIAITRHEDGYFFNHVDGHVSPLLNGLPAGKGERRLVHGDAIELSGTTMVFCLSPA